MRPKFRVTAFHDTCISRSQALYSFFNAMCLSWSSYPNPREPVLFFYKIPTYGPGTIDTSVTPAM
jgi:hypothetical protein